MVKKSQKIPQKQKQKERALKIAEKLKKAYPKPKTELNFENEMQLVVAVMLSAQTTDVKVNEVTERLFGKYTSWKDFANTDPKEIQEDIYGVNFHKTKAERLHDTAQKILNEFDGEIPRRIGDLTKLPGIARKSANVILQELWDIAQGIVVDTHVKRVSNRLGLVDTTNPKKIEEKLMDLLPKEYWRNYSGAVVLHGRYVCKARKPKCDECVLKDLCPSAFDFDHFD